MESALNYFNISAKEVICNSATFRSAQIGNCEWTWETIILLCFLYSFWVFLEALNKDVPK